MGEGPRIHGGVNSGRVVWMVGGGRRVSHLDELIVGRVQVRSQCGRVARPHHRIRVGAVRGELGHREVEQPRGRRAEREQIFGRRVDLKPVRGAVSGW